MELDGLKFDREFDGINTEKLEKTILCLNGINLIDGIGDEIESHREEANRLERLVWDTKESGAGFVKAPEGYYFTIKASMNEFKLSHYMPKCGYEDEGWSFTVNRKPKDSGPLDDYIFIADRIVNDRSGLENPFAAFAYSPTGDLRCRIKPSDKVGLCPIEDFPPKVINPDEKAEEIIIREQY